MDNRRGRICFCGPGFPAGSYNYLKSLEDPKKPIRTQCPICEKFGDEIMNPLGSIGVLISKEE